MLFGYTQIEAMKMDKNAFYIHKKSSSVTVTYHCITDYL